MSLQDDIHWARGRLAKLDPESDELDRKLNRIARQALTRAGGKTQTRSARQFATALWRTGEHLERRLAVRFLRRYGERLPGSFWHLYHAWILDTNERELRDEIAEWLVGALVNAGTLEPGLPVGSFEIFDAPFTQTTTGRLRILISGSPASNLYGQLHCSNIATLAGIVEVSADGFFPQIGDEYEIVVSDLFIQGEFTGVVAVNLPGLGFELVHDFDRVLLVVVELACPADLDGDGTVGITDFLALLGAWGTDPGGPPDLDGDGQLALHFLHVSL